MTEPFYKTSEQYGNGITATEPEAITEEMKPKLISEKTLEFINNDTTCLAGCQSKSYWELLESHLILYEKYEALKKRLNYPMGRRYHPF